MARRCGNCIHKNVCELYDIVQDPTHAVGCGNFLDTADVVPRAELEHTLSDLKKEIHDKAVYPNCHGVEPYISLKVFDAVINKFIGS